jgi:hypothetical protein
MLKRFATLASGAAFAVSLLFPSNAFSQCQFTSLLNSPNDALNAFPPPGGSYGTVCVNLVNSATATITFTASDGFLFGAVDAMALNINTAGPFAASASAITFPGHNSPSLTITSPPGSQVVGGQGVFNLVAANSDGFPDSFQIGTFTVNLLAGSFANAASVLAFNASGVDAAAHIFVCADAACSIAGGASATGFAGETGGTVPEPTTVTLLGGVVLYVTSRLRKRFA